MSKKCFIGLTLSILFLKVDPLGSYLLQHMFYAVYTDTFSVNLSTDFIFGCSLKETWTMYICEERSRSLYFPQSPVSWIVNKCTQKDPRLLVLLSMLRWCNWSWAKFCLISRSNLLFIDIFDPHSWNLIELSQWIWLNQGRI